MIATEAAAEAGITVRMLDIWTRAGHVQADFAVFGRPGHLLQLTEDEIRQLPEKWRRDPVRPGSGASRFYADAEVQVLIHLASLWRLGFRVDAAEKIARQLAEHPMLPVWLGEGTELRVLPDVGHAQAPDDVWAQRMAHGAQEAAELARQFEAAHRLVEQ